MRKEILEDLYRYVGRKSQNIFVQIRYVIFTPGFRYIYFYRKTSLAKHKVSRFFYHYCMRCCMLKYGIQIPYQTRIGRGFRILHFGHIVINPAAVIGNNFNICQGALIGSASGKRKGVPKIGNNVYIGANAIVIGGINIEDNVLIAPGAFVNFDVPSNSIVIGNPGKIIHKDNPTAPYIVFPV